MTIKIEAYRSSDGLLFSTEKECKQYELKKAFFDACHDNKLYGNYEGSYVDPQDLLDYVETNWAMLATILGKR